MREDFEKRLSPEPLNSSSPVVHRGTVRLMLILQCVIGLLVQSIDFTNNFSWADIPSVVSVFIELPRDFYRDGLQCDIFLGLQENIW